MKPYRSLFKEENLKATEPMGWQDVYKVVSISNLKWGKSMSARNWESASKAPAGYRLPTIQELKSSLNEVSGFKRELYWTSSPYQGAEDELFWVVDFRYFDVQTIEKDKKAFVRYVKDK